MLTIKWETFDRKPDSCPDPRGVWSEWDIENKFTGRNSNVRGSRKVKA